jgi:hypothetical protein
MSKPLFIPLKAEFFEAFERGEKDTEYRVYGPRREPVKSAAWKACYGESAAAFAACIRIKLKPSVETAA